MNSKVRFALFVIVALVQLAVAGNSIVQSELALRSGEAIRFQIQPVDPVDAFRGRYVAIRFAVDRALVADGVEIRPRKFVFVPVQVGADGFNTAFQGIFPGCQVCQGRGLGLAITDENLAAVHVLHDALHECRWTDGARHDAGTQCLQLEDTE